MSSNSLCVIILVIKQIGRPCILLTIRGLQTGLDSTQSYFHYLQLKCCGPAGRARLQASFLMLLLLFSLCKLKSEIFWSTCLYRLWVSLDKEAVIYLMFSGFSFKPASWQPAPLILRRRKTSSLCFTYISYLFWNNYENNRSEYIHRRYLRIPADGYWGKMTDILSFALKLPPTLNK